MSYGNLSGKNFNEKKQYRPASEVPITEQPEKKEPEVMALRIGRSSFLQRFDNATKFSIA
jgi:hypothetical protein